RQRRRPLRYLLSFPTRRSSDLAGFTVYMPSLFGRDGAVPDAEEGKAVFQRACVSAEFHAFAMNRSSPVTQWLRALARQAHAECRSEEHTSELQSRENLVCRLLL